MKSYVGRFIPLLFFIALGITIGNALIFFASLHDLITNEQWVTHTHRVIDEVNNAYTSLKEAESSERGFIITNDSKYITPFNSTILFVDRYLNQARVLTSDNPSQRKNIEKLKKMADQRITLLKQGITDGQLNDFTSAQTLVDSDKGFILMQQIKDLVMSIDKKEESLLQIRAQQSAVSVEKMYTTITFSMIINLLLIFVAFFFIRRELGQRTASEQRKNDFISIASHELKTPITSMSIFADLLQKRIATYKDRRASHYLSKIQQQITKQISLINDLLDISKIQAGKITLKKELCDVNTLVRETVEVMQATTKTHKISIKGKVSNKVIADRQRLGQVLINFLSNAIKYSPNAKKVIVEMKENKRFVQINVKDFGIGIPKRYHKKVFSRFFRATDESKGSFPGLGIGLYITSEIIRHHAGRIWVESIEGKGSTFSFELPIKQDNKI